MSVDSSAPRLIATWNPARGVWETDQAAICGHSEPFLATWPTSGMTRNGTAYELPTPGHHTDDSGSSLLHTPRATRGGSSTENAKALLPTPDAQMGNGGRVQSMEALRRGNRQAHMNDVARLLELS